jgi:flagellar motor switch protein FliN
MQAIVSGTPLHYFSEAISRSTGQALSSALGPGWSVEFETAQAGLSAQTPCVSFQLSASGGLQGKASIRFGFATALSRAQRLLAQPANPSADLNEDRKKVLQEFLEGALKAATPPLRSKFGDLELSVSDDNQPVQSQPSTQQAPGIALLASENGSGKFSIEIRLDSELLTNLSSKSAGASNPSGDAEMRAVAPAHEPNFDLLLGVNLGLTLRFGRGLLPLREILDLSSGSVVELDQEVQEPADLLLGDKVIARGQVVIVDGNYGIQITEVEDTRQRMGTL